MDLILTDEQWLVVHDVRLRGTVEVPDETVVALLVADDLAIVKGGRVALTAAGRRYHADWALVPEESAAHQAVRLLYDGFHELNVELLSVCTAWQVLPSGARNEHRDAHYDWEVIARLERLHERAAPRVRRVARDVTRFESYSPRLRYALAQVVDRGNPEWLTGARVDSYHTVWNHLHEDLLVALGRERHEEPQP